MVGGVSSQGETIPWNVSATATKVPLTLSEEYDPANYQAMYGPGAVEVSELPPSSGQITPTIAGLDAAAAAENPLAGMGVGASADTSSLIQLASAAPDGQGIETVTVTGTRPTNIQQYNAYIARTGKKQTVFFVGGFDDTTPLFDGTHGNSVAEYQQRFAAKYPGIPSQYFNGQNQQDELALEQAINDAANNGYSVIVVGQSMGGPMAALAALNTQNVDVLVTSDPTQGPYTTASDVPNPPSPGATTWTQQDLKNVAGSVMVWVDTTDKISIVDAFNNWGYDVQGTAPNVTFEDYSSGSSAIKHGDFGGNMNNLIKEGQLPIISPSGTRFPYTNYHQVNGVYVVNPND